MDVNKLCNLQQLATQDKFLRLNAEFDNYRKRSAKEKSDAVNKAKGGVVSVRTRCRNRRSAHKFHCSATAAAAAACAKLQTRNTFSPH